MSTATVLTRTSRAEWHRIWSVRSSWIFAAVITVVVIGFGTITGYDVADDPAGAGPDASAWDGGRLTGMFATFGVVAMSVVASTADHGTGGIVPTLQWTPRRGVLLAARAGFIGATTTMLGGMLARPLACPALALFLNFGEGPADDMTTTSARLTLAAWAVAALLADGWRLLRTDAVR